MKRIRKMDLFLNAIARSFNVNVMIFLIIIGKASHECLIENMSGAIHQKPERPDEVQQFVWPGFLSLPADGT